MSQIRAFIAIPVDDAVRAEMARVQEQLQDALGGRIVLWVQRPNMHFTLKFLGNVGVDDVAGIRTRLERIAERFSPLQLGARGLACFPNLTHPRNVWAQLYGDTTTTTLLAAEIDKELETLGVARDTRGFTPHLTIGRVRREATSRERARLGELVGLQNSTMFGEINAHHIELIQSDLQPHSPHYTTLARIPLIGAK
jgi:2'-5' RNA ligase